MKIAMVCGEASGDALGAGLAKALRAQNPALELAGVTGPAMRAADVREWLDCSVFSVMGYWSALKRLPRLLLARHKLLGALERERPRVLVGIDAPDLNLSLAEHCKKMQVRYVQYICPSFWAWRQQRKEQLARFCDQVLLALPFEKKLCEQAGIPSTYVGHRLVDEVRSGPEVKASSRKKLGMARDTKILALLPGSRVQELEAHTAMFAHAAQIVKSEVAGLQMAWAPLGQMKQTAQMPDSKIFPGQARLLLQAADAALVKSGTITLEAMLSGCPQVIAYRVPGIGGVLAKRKFTDLSKQFFGLPNLIAGKKIVPELIQANATPAAIAGELITLLEGGGKAQLEAYEQTTKMLVNETDVDAAAASAVLQVAQS